MRVMTLIVVVVVALSGCDRRREDLRSGAQPSSPPIASSAPPPPAPSPPLAVDSKPVNVIVPGDRYAVVVRGAREHGLAMLFMAGMCMHPGGYAGAFEHAAAERGVLVALQADVSCGGGPDSPVRMWSSDLDALDRRIDAAFVASGYGVPAEVVVIGYSQGAERAEHLVARWPKKYSRAVLIASPYGPSPKNLAKARAVVLMAGTFDVSLARMRSAAPAIAREGVRAEFRLLPNAWHGQMGDTPEESMRAALDFVAP